MAGGRLLLLTASGRHSRHDHGRGSDAPVIFSGQTFAGKSQIPFLVIS
jgi:hypothetical protein